MIIYSLAQDFIHQFADVFAPHFSSSGVLGHEGDAVQLREKVVQTLHACAERQVGTVQTGLDVVPGRSMRQSNFIVNVFPPKEGLF